MNSNIKKVLVIRFSSIGDIVWTSPVIRCIKKQIPGVELHYCTKIQYKSMVEASPYIDKFFFLEDSLSSLIAKLKIEKYDFVIDLHRNIRTSMIKWRLGAPSKAYDKLRIKRFLYTNFQIDLMPNCHVVDRYFETTSTLGVVNDDEGLDYYISEKDEVEPEWLPETHRNGYVAYVIGATGWTKILPFEKMVELCDKINKPIILVGGKEDVEAGAKLETFFNAESDNEEMAEGLKELGKKTVIF